MVFIFTSINSFCIFLVLVPFNSLFRTLQFSLGFFLLQSLPFWSLKTEFSSTRDLTSLNPRDLLYFFHHFPPSHPFDRPQAFPIFAWQCPTPFFRVLRETFGCKVAIFVEILTIFPLFPPIFRTKFRFSTSRFPIDPKFPPCTSLVP